MSADPSSLDWNGEDLLLLRHQKSAAGLLAIHAALGQHPGLSASAPQLSWSVARLREAPSDAFTAIWTDPTAYLWVRLTYDLVAAGLGRADLTPLVEDYVAAVAGPDGHGRALDRLLDDVRRFVVALHVRQGSTVTLPTPLRVTLPLALPGVPWVIEGEGELDLLAVEAGQVRASHPGGPESFLVSTTSEPARLERSLEVQVADYALRLEPRLFILPSFEFARPVMKAGVEYHRRHAALIQSTLARIADATPHRFAQLRETIRAVGLKPRTRGEYTNISHSHLPGAFVAAVAESSLELADTFIHELHHNRLFFLEERERLFADADDGRGEDQVVYSPWRDELRPVIGLYHAVYVHLPVTEFWLATLERGPLTEAEREYAVERVVRYLGQLSVGVERLEAVAALTAVGRALLDRMKARLGELEAEARRAGLPDDVPARQIRDDGTTEPERDDRGQPMSVREALAHHRTQVEAQR